MDDTVARGDNSEVFESFLTPLEEGKTLLVTVEFDFLILFLCVGISSNINLNGVVDN